MADNPSQRRYPPELRERAVRMVFETIEAQPGERFGVVTRIARQLGIGPRPCSSGSRPGHKYNPSRRHSSIGDLSPVDYEATRTSASAAA